MAKPRRVPGILALVAVGTVVCIVIKTFTWYPNLVSLSPSKRPTKEKTNVLILAQGRSGSSFLGQIFNSHQEVFYIYEPLITFQLTTVRDSKLYEQSTMRLLRDIFSCRFNQQREFLSFMSNMPLNRFSSRALTSPYCKNLTSARENRTYMHCQDLDPLITSLSCVVHKHIVVKVLLHRLLPLLDVDKLAPLFNSSSKLKIIHLMRDPRAVIASMDRVGWTLNNDVVNTATKDFSLFKTFARKFCYDMVRSLSFALSAEAKFPHNYKLIRYEDLVRSPYKLATELFDFAAFPISDHVYEFLANSTNSHDRRSVHEYATFRSNASLLVDSWRRHLGLDAVRAIENYCWPVLEILRYTPMSGQS